MVMASDDDLMELALSDARLFYRPNLLTEVDPDERRRFIDQKYEEWQERRKKFIEEGVRPQDIGVLK